MGKHSEENTKNNKKKIWITLAIIIVILAMILIFPKQIGYVIGWILGKIASIFR